MREFNKLVEFLQAVKVEGLVTRQESSSPSYFGAPEETFWLAYEPTGEERGLFASGWDVESGPYSGGFLADSAKEWVDSYSEF